MDDSTLTCKRCGRRRWSPETEDRTAHQRAAYGYVVHDSYGCETGCCGHWYILADRNGHEVSRHFEFSHPYGADEAFTKDIEDWAKSEGVHVHWYECVISDD